MSNENSQTENDRLNAKVIETYTNPKDLATYKAKLVKEQEKLLTITAPTPEQQTRINEINEVIGTKAGRDALTDAKARKKAGTATEKDEQIISAETNINEDYALMLAYFNEKAKANAEAAFESFPEPYRGRQIQSYIRNLELIVKSHIRTCELEKAETLEDKMKKDFEEKVKPFVPEGYTARLVKTTTPKVKSVMENDGQGHVKTDGDTTKKYWRVYKPNGAEGETVGIYKNAKAAMVDLHPKYNNGEKYNENLNAANVIYRFVSEHGLMVDKNFENPTEQIKMGLDEKAPSETTPVQS